MFSGTVVLWRGFYRECIRGSFDSYEAALAWVREQKLTHGSAFVQGYVV